MNVAEIYSTDAQLWLAELGLWASTRSYDAATKAWLAKSGHYLNDPPPSCILCVGLQALGPGLFGAAPGGALLGLALLGRPIARNLAQNGTVLELTRFVLDPKFEKTQVASHMLRVAIERAAGTHAIAVISYHRSRHSGCIYRKSGFRKDGVTRPGTRRGTWASRPGREQAAAAEQPSKRRWRIELDQVRAAVAARAMQQPVTT